MKQIRCYESMGNVDLHCSFSMPHKGGLSLANMHIMHENRIVIYCMFVITEYVITIVITANILCVCVCFHTNVENAFYLKAFRNLEPSTSHRYN